MTVKLLNKSEESNPIINNRLRKYRAQDKYNIIMEAEDLKDYISISKKYNLDVSTLYKWKKQITTDEYEFKRKDYTRKENQEIDRLKLEIERLKETIVTLANEITSLRNRGKK